MVPSDCLFALPGSGNEDICIYGMRPRRVTNALPLQLAAITLSYDWRQEDGRRRVVVHAYIDRVEQHGICVPYVFISFFVLS